ncbi:hypothetical protein [Clostridium sp. AM58-1XD]|uniref:hypothetical protein n=1 Tax=Clostridium sp. AM58-1XD TaxID=2292307 RepID=UPI000E4F74FC|nr:hypothetical protein [Clostridium sp. AM58-1XD]RGZ01891.1 hypothetical protein DXA13_00890 [Clostridium sp. AM58-1XD]
MKISDKPDCKQVIAPAFPVEEQLRYPSLTGGSYPTMFTVPGINLRRNLAADFPRLPQKISRG